MNTVFHNIMLCLLLINLAAWTYAACHLFKWIVTRYRYQFKICMDIYKCFKAYEDDQQIEFELHDS